MSITIEVLELFAEAHGRVEQPMPDFTAFVVPQQGKSGLSRGTTPTPEEFRARRAEYSRRDFQKRMSDPVKAARVRALRRERVRRWRARKAAEGRS